MERSPSLIILFDGVCNLCSGAVQFVLKRDKKKIFRYGSLQGKRGQVLLQQHSLPLTEMNSFILLDEGKIYTRSTAALRVLRHLGGPYTALSWLMIIPSFIRDGVYDFIARNRYRWFGKKNECWLPRTEWKDLFIDNLDQVP